jgi:Domain of unknown function (DUF5642)
VPAAKLLIGSVCTGLLVGCGGHTDTSAKPLDIAKVFTLRSTLEPNFHVTTIGPSAIDPKVLRSLAPSRETVDPAECQKQASGQILPPDLTGKMAVISADGKGDAFAVTAIESSGPLPHNFTIPENCRHVTFSGNIAGMDVSGTTDIVGAPKIDGAQTVGMHIKSTIPTIPGMPRQTELYLYGAVLGNYAVEVTAGPRFDPNHPAAPIDTGRAQKLLTDGVAAIRS